MSKEVAVVILNWNGKSFLEQFLPSIVKNSIEEADVIVADNFSSDDSIHFIKENYPQVKILPLEANYGFAGGYNRALKKLTYPYYVLLNSDVEVTENWLSPMIKMLNKDSSIAACQPKIKAYHNKSHFEYAGAAGGFIDKYGYPFCQGRIFDTIEEDIGQYETEKEIFWASGASLFIRSEFYHKAGGLDEFFFAHMEEIDLCWRIKNMKGRIMYCPKSTVYHVGGGTLNKTKPKKTFLNYRNNLLMLHKNLPKNKRFSTIFIRLFLDGISGIRLLLSGQIGHVFAIIKAHFSFYGALGQNSKKRIAHNYEFPKGMLNLSIIKAYFLKNLKTYQSIVK